MNISSENFQFMNVIPPTDPKLLQKTERIRWKSIKNLDVEKIVENNDIFSLENFLPNIMNCKITKEEFQKTDKKSLAKLLRIFQMSLEYFSYTHNYMNDLKEKLDKENEENEKLVSTRLILFKKFNKDQRRKRKS